jgi:hypothetical protein
MSEPKWQDPPKLDSNGFVFIQSQYSFRTCVNGVILLVKDYEYVFKDLDEMFNWIKRIENP